MALAVLAVFAGLAASNLAQAQHHGHGHGQHSRWMSPCGCGWSNQGACGISTQQMVRSLTKSKIDDLCNKTHNQGEATKTTDDIRLNEPMLQRAKMITHYECLSRREIRNKLPSYQKCEGLTSEQCASTEECQIGAQQAFKCGIDEGQLILDLVGKQFHNHPLVKIVNASSQCKEKSEQFCDADPACKFRGYHCDMREEFFFGQAIAHPEILLLLELLEFNSYCHFFDEAYDFCGGFCREEAGICRFNASKLTDYNKRQTHRLVNVMCRPNRTECLSPCVNASGMCSPPPSLATDMHHSNLTHADWHIFGLMLQLESSTAMIESRCNFFDSNETLCLYHNESCEIHHFKSWVSTTTGYTGPSTTTMRTTTEYGYTPPMTTSTTSDDSLFGGAGGILGRLIGNSGELADKIEKMVEENPEVLKNLRDSVEKSLQEKESKEKPQDDDDEDEDESMMDEPVTLIAGAFLLFGCGIAMMSWSCGMVCGRGYRRSEARALLQAGDGSTADYERGAGQ